VPILQVLIFRGTGGVYNVDHPYHTEPALVRAGHVGVVGVVDEAIVGFHPTPEAIEAAGGETALLDALRENQPQPGRLQVDDAYFRRARELSELTDGRTTVYTYEVEVSAQTLREIRSWYNNAQESLYNFPNDDGRFDAGESNCALFWNRFGIPMPVNTGQIREIVERMEDESYSVWKGDS